MPPHEYGWLAHEPLRRYDAAYIKRPPLKVSQHRTMLINQDRAAADHTGVIVSQESLYRCCHSARRIEVIGVEIGHDVTGRALPPFVDCVSLPSIRLAHPVGQLVLVLLDDADAA